MTPTTRTAIVLVGGIAGCLAVQALLPQGGAWIGSLLASGKAAQDIGGGFSGLGSNLVAGVLQSRWSRHREQIDIHANQHLLKTLREAILSGIRDSEFGADPKVIGAIEGHMRTDAWVNLLLGGAVENPEQVMLMGLNEPERCFEPAWTSLLEVLQAHRKSALTEEQREGLRAQILGQMKARVAQHLLTDALAREKFAFYADQVQMELLSDLSGQANQMGDDFGAIRSELAGLGKLSHLADHFSAATEALAKELGGVTGRMAEIEIALARTRVTDEFLEKYQIAQTRSNIATRRRQLALCVGREAEFQRLFQQLTEPDARRFILVKGESGTGKSSFMNGLLGRPELAEYRVAYHFFKNDLGVLSQPRFALLHLVATMRQSTTDVAIPLAQNALTADIAATLAGLLEDRAKADSRPILVLVDALDEADAGYEDFFTWMADPPEGVFVVASVRAAHEERPTPLPKGCDRFEPFKLEQRLSEEAVREWMELKGDGELRPYARDYAGLVHRSADGHSLFLSYILSGLSESLRNGGATDWTAMAVQLGEGSSAGEAFDDYVRGQWEQILNNKDARTWAGMLMLLAAAHGEMPATAVQHVGLSCSLAPWLVKRWVRFRKTGLNQGEEYMRFEHPRIKASFLNLTEFRSGVVQQRELLWKACRDRQAWLSADYRLRNGIRHALECAEAGSVDALEWTFDRLTDGPYVEEKVKAGLVPYLIREYADADRLANQLEKEGRHAF